MAPLPEENKATFADKAKKVLKTPAGKVGLGIAAVAVILIPTILIVSANRNKGKRVVKGKQSESDSSAVSENLPGGGAGGSSGSNQGSADALVAGALLNAEEVDEEALKNMDEETLNKKFEELKKQPGADQSKLEKSQEELLKRRAEALKKTGGVPPSGDAPPAPSGVPPPPPPPPPGGAPPPPPPPPPTTTQIADRLKNLNHVNLDTTKKVFEHVGIAKDVHENAIAIKGFIVTTFADKAHMIDEDQLAEFEKNKAAGVKFLEKRMLETLKVTELSKEQKADCEKEFDQKVTEIKTCIEFMKTLKRVKTSDAEKQKPENIKILRDSFAHVAEWGENPEEVRKYAYPEIEAAMKVIKDLFESSKTASTDAAKEKIFDDIAAQHKIIKKAVDEQKNAAICPAVQNFVTLPIIDAAADKVAAFTQVTNALAAFAKDEVMRPYYSEKKACMDAMEKTANGLQRELVIIESIEKLKDALKNITGKYTDEDADANLRLTDEASIVTFIRNFGLKLLEQTFTPEAGKTEYNANFCLKLSDSKAFNKVEFLVEKMIKDKSLFPAHHQSPKFFQEFLLKNALSKNAPLTDEEKDFVYSKLTQVKNIDKAGATKWTQEAVIREKLIDDAALIKEAADFEVERLKMETCDAADLEANFNKCDKLFMSLATKFSKLREGTQTWKFALNKAYQQFTCATSFAHGFKLFYEDLKSKSSSDAQKVARFDAIIGLFSKDAVSSKSAAGAKSAAPKVTDEKIEEMKVEFNNFLEGFFALKSPDLEDYQNLNNSIKQIQDKLVTASPEQVSSFDLLKVLPKILNETLLGSIALKDEDNDKVNNIYGYLCTVTDDDSLYARFHPIDEYKDMMWREKGDSNQKYYAKKHKALKELEESLFDEDRLMFESAVVKVKNLRSDSQIVDNDPDSRYVKLVDDTTLTLSVLNSISLAKKSRLEFLNGFDAFKIPEYFALLNDPKFVQEMGCIRSRLESLLILSLNIEVGTKMLIGDAIKGSDLKILKKTLLAKCQEVAVNEYKVSELFVGKLDLLGLYLEAIFVAVSKEKGDKGLIPMSVMLYKTGYAENFSKKDHIVKAMLFSKQMEGLSNASEMEERMIFLKEMVRGDKTGGVRKEDDPEALLNYLARNMIEDLIDALRECDLQSSDYLKYRSYVMLAAKNYNKLLKGHVLYGQTDEKMSELVSELLGKQRVTHEWIEHKTPASNQQQQGQSEGKQQSQEEPRQSDEHFEGEEGQDFEQLNQEQKNDRGQHKKEVSEKWGASTVSINRAAQQVEQAQNEDEQQGQQETSDQTTLLDIYGEPINEDDESKDQRKSQLDRVTKILGQDPSELNEENFPERIGEFGLSAKYAKVTLEDVVFACALNSKFADFKRFIFNMKDTNEAVDRILNRIVGAIKECNLPMVIRYSNVVRTDYQFNEAHVQRNTESLWNALDHMKSQATGERKMVFGEIHKIIDTIYQAHYI